MCSRCGSRWDRPSVVNCGLRVVAVAVLIDVRIVLHSSGCGARCESGTHVARVASEASQTGAKGGAVVQHEADRPCELFLGQPRSACLLALED